MLLQSQPNTAEKLEILAGDAKYDISCACGMSKEDRRVRSELGRWIYPTTMADGRKTYLFRTLLSNHCANDCVYCPLQRNRDPNRCTLEPMETAKLFMDYWRKKRVSGLFLSSGLFRSPDNTMDQLLTTVHIIRRMGFRGYVHLKVMPGTSDAAIEEALKLSSAVSINIEAPGEQRFRQLSQSKNYIQDVIRPMKKISQLIQNVDRFRRIKQTTQFIVGAADETDSEIVQYMAAGYERLKLHRVYFSAYQPEEIPLLDAQQYADSQYRMNREHRLYQVDFLLRKYGFSADEIGFDDEGNPQMLSTIVDPKTRWAQNHPEFFPLDINTAEKEELLRVPGFGPITVKRILELRKNSSRVNSLDQIGKVTQTMAKALSYIYF